MGHKPVDEPGDRGFSAAGIPGQHNELALFYGKRQTVYSTGFLLLAKGVGVLIVKGYVLKLDYRSTSI